MADKTPEEQADLEKLLDDKITAPVTEEAPPTTKRGRPKKQSATPKKETVTAEIVLPVPPVNEAEAFMFAQVFSGVASMFIKKEYKDKLTVTVEELLPVMRPLVQLKAYYMPNFGGIYAVWGQLAFTGGALALSKYSIVKEIMETDGKRPDNTRSIETVGNGTAGNVASVPTADGSKQQGDSSAVAREENNSNSRDTGNGQVYASQAFTEIAQQGNNL